MCGYVGVCEGGSVRCEAIKERLFEIYRGSESCLL